MPSRPGSPSGLTIRRRARAEQRRRYAAHHNPESPGPPPPATDGPVLYEKRDRIAYVTINRPEARNAIDPDVHRLMIEAWADFRDDDSVDVAILTGAGDGVLRRRRPEDLHPADHGRGASPADIREIVELGLNGFTRGMHRIPSRSSARSTAGRSPAASRPRSPATSGSPPSARCSAPSRRGAASTTATAAWCGSSTPAASASPRTCCSPPSRSTPSRRCSGTSSPRSSRTRRLMEEAETVARQILRNSQRAVRSAKQTILDMIGQPLDDQLRTEAWNAYTCADPEETLALLGRFYEKTDAGPRRRARHGLERAAAAASSVRRVARPRDLQLAPHVLAQGRWRLARGGRRARRRGSAEPALARRVADRLAQLASSARSARPAPEQLAKSRGPRASGSSPARSSRATTAQTLAATSTWKRCSRGTSARDARRTGTRRRRRAARPRSGGPGSRRRPESARAGPTPARRSAGRARRARGSAAAR